MNMQHPFSTTATRYILAALGWLCVFLGVLGIFLPLLPTTVFVLIAGWCFSKSSKRFELWLLNQPSLGPIVINWRSGRGIPHRARNRAILLMWLTMSISMLIVGKPLVVIILGLTGALVSAYLLHLPVLEENPELVETRCPLNKLDNLKNWQVERKA